MEATHDLFGMLQEDHKRLLELLAQLAATTGDDRHSLIHHIDRAFRIHAQAEEEIVYPVYQECIEGRDAALQVAEHRAEHTVCKELLDGIMTAESGTAFHDRLRRLRRAVEEHAGREERDMFPAMRRNCPTATLEALARDVAVCKDRLMTRFG